VYKIRDNERLFFSPTSAMKVIFLGFLIFFIRHSSALNNKIINGQLARDAQFPHMTQISIKTKNSDSKQYCGGSLLDNQWILTVIKCLLT
jgi:secreted trypsin-like serine protease